MCSKLLCRVNMFSYITKNLLRPKRIRNYRNLSMKEILSSNYTKVVALTTGIVGIGATALTSRLLADTGSNNFKAGMIDVSSRDKNNFIVDVTKKCHRSVVFIEIKDPRRILPESGQPITSSNGSGFVVNSDGYILTNAHVVINKPNSITMVTTSDGSTYKASIEDIDMKSDLALLKIPCDTLPALRLGESDDVYPGEWVVALGSPLSLSQSISAGVISSVGRNSKDLGLNNDNMKYIQTDAAITFGHSGGPLVNLNGEVVGINNLRITAGISFAIPIAYVKEFLDHSTMNFPKKSVVSNKNFLGITTVSINSGVLRQLMMENQQIPENLTKGLLVWKVVEQTPAHAAGLLSGDIITHVNDKPVSECSDIYKLLSGAGGRSNFSIYRYTKKRNITLCVANEQ